MQLNLNPVSRIVRAFHRRWREMFIELTSPYAYAAILSCYGVSLTLFFIDFLRDNKLANRVGLVILGLVWVLETLLLGQRVLAQHALPLYSYVQATLFFSWLLISLSVAISIFSRIDFFTLFVNLFGFLLVGFDAIVHGHLAKAVPQQGDLLVLHISVSILSYLLFSVSAIFSVLYLLEDAALRKKRFASGPFRRLPALQRLDVYAYRTALVGGPLLLIGMMVGAIWYDMLTGHFLWLDPKPIASGLLLLLYFVYLWLRGTERISGRRAAWFNLISFVGVLLNFLVIGEFMSSFHRW